MPRIRIPKIKMPKKVIALGAAAAALAAGTVLAVWVVLSTISLGPNTTGTATLQTAGITATSGSDCVTAQTAMWPALTNMGPGDFRTGFTCLHNTSAQTESYAATSTNTNAILAAGMKVRVTSAGTASSAAAAAALSCTLPNMDSTGAAVGAQAEVFLGFETTFGWGNPAAQTQAGDRTLDTSANAYEKLCTEVLLPTGASTTLQNQTNDNTVTITASP